MRAPRDGIIGMFSTFYWASLDFLSSLAWMLPDREISHRGVCRAMTRIHRTNKVNELDAAYHVRPGA